MKIDERKNDFSEWREEFYQAMIDTDYPEGCNADEELIGLYNSNPWEPCENLVDCMRKADFSETQMKAYISASKRRIYEYNNEF